jgi:ribokinase
VEFRGIDATSILDRALVDEHPGTGGIAHLTSAITAADGRAAAVSWVGDDAGGRAWSAAVARSGTSIDGVSVSGERTPAATLIEIASGGTICLFDPGDCHLDRLTDAQRAVIAASDWVLLTVAPRDTTIEVLAVLRPSTRLAWAVKHDEDAYAPDLALRILARADVVSFSRGERDWLSFDGVAPESRVRGGSLVIETRGADGVAWSFAGDGGPERHGELAVDPVAADDTTGAGDTFIGTLLATLAAGPGLASVDDDELRDLIRSASLAAGEVLRRRPAIRHVAVAPQKENTHVE